MSEPVKPEKVMERLDDRYWLLYRENGVYLCRNESDGKRTASVALEMYRNKDDAMKGYRKFRHEDRKR